MSLVWKKGPQKKNLIWTGIRLVCYKAIKKERKNTWQRNKRRRKKGWKSK
jgi:hypothetical protein